MPIATDIAEWNPTNYGQAADAAGQRRPTCVEIKTTAVNGVEAIQFLDNYCEGGDLGFSFGSIDRMNYSGNTARLQTHYCLELATGDECSGAGNHFDGRNAIKVVSTTNMRVTSLPGSYIVGPKHQGLGTETALASDGDTEVLNFSGSTFVGATAGPIIRLNGGSASNEIVNLVGAVFIGDPAIAMDALEVNSTIDTVNLTGANFQGITGDTLHNNGTIVNLVTVGLTETNCGGTATLGTVTSHMDAFNVTGAFAGRALTLQRLTLDASTSALNVSAGTNNWNYNGAAFAYFRSSNQITFATPTADGADAGFFKVSGGGTASQFRGGLLEVFGLEHATQSGQAVLSSGVNRDVKMVSNGTGNVVLETAGTGNVQYGTHSAVGSETITGYIEIKDASGTLRKLAVLS